MPPPPSRFAPGDRVLAPWEPQWLYPATVTDTDDFEELAAGQGAPRERTPR